MENDKSGNFSYTIVRLLSVEKADVNFLHVNFKDLSVCVRPFQEVGFRLLRDTVQFARKVPRQLVDPS